MSAEGDPAGQGGNKPNRPPRKKSQKRQRSKQIKTPCTPDEYQAISAKADAAGMTRAAYSRTAMLGNAGPRSQRRMPADAEALREILGHLGRVGNNINQIAYRINKGDPCDLPELRQALADYAPIRNAIYQALGLDPSADIGPKKAGT
jgi:hypothetical protein